MNMDRDTQKPIPAASNADDRLPKHSDEQDHALSPEENLEESLVDSMDASDPPSATQPGDHGDPVPSSGFTDADEKAARKTHPA